MFRSLQKMILVGVLAVATAVGVGGPANARDVSTWDAIQDRGNLRIGVTQAPPWFINNPATNEWSGLGVSVGGAMAETMGVALEPVEVSWGTADSALQADKIDIMFVLDATPARAVADRILFLSEGRILEQSTPAEVLTYPKEDGTKDFLRVHGRFRLPEPQID